MPIADKVYFVQDARQEVIELGLGLTTFSKWFSGQRPSEWRDYIENLVAKAVNVTLLAIDPEWPVTKQYFLDRGEEGYIDEIRNALRLLDREKERLLKKGLQGNFEVSLYRSFPSVVSHKRLVLFFFALRERGKVQPG